MITLKKRQNIICAVLLHLIMSFLVVNAQDTGDSKKPDSDEELAKKLANPNATLGQMLFPIDYVNYNGDIPDANQNGFVLNFQPSLPIPISQGINLYVRPLIPVFLSQPVLGINGFENKGGLGNISADVAIGKTWPSKWITLVGVFGGFPTASNKALRASQVTLGPEIMAAKLTKWGVLGLMVSQAIGVGSVKDYAGGTIFTNDVFGTSTGPKSASVTAGQYFYTVNLSKGWQISATPTYAYNHRGTKGNKLSLPIGTGAQKVLKFGKLPVRMGLQYWYYVASPDAFGPQHQIRFTFAPVVPLPW
ncbi:hypothetical protein KFZ70_03160 [Tamlana fucoidanivorans]|uniref:Transporter n=1 Tax=Allotamlana fucoidanivorans TaxID=2583814 RepID=A0A5C4SKC9_9FLAO|nr:hypothetical protein [Tamlana fucoidanivorans]TNJ44303.1 hypothetical protein FGF67_09760 [Tamlana fucoidanivorans]